MHAVHRLRERHFENPGRAAAIQRRRSTGELLPERFTAERGQDCPDQRECGRRMVSIARFLRR
jgi:hypothetical protein